jgi:hypothetical protein
MGASAERRVYVKKEEFDGDAGGFPHLRDEIGCIRLVEGLSMQDCRNLFPALRRCGGGSSGSAAANGRKRGCRRPTRRRSGARLLPG